MIQQPTDMIKTLLLLYMIDMANKQHNTTNNPTRQQQSSRFFCYYQKTTNPTQAQQPVAAK
jgi:glycosylphosphatidylinositol transamidase (GPIT) subunit GPI8